ncbi:hypothetical protein SDC9_87094 [bioreactor metagenome]|uniref:Uncharacterized protein n=1 Tax=bioreactor metagenome TaxID=1076179 RepID=A0A644ZHV3_9ZZZZ
MTRIPTISINDDFSPSQTGIAFRSSNDKATSRIDEVFRISIQQGIVDDHMDDMLQNIFFQLFQRDILVMLCAQNDRVHTFRFAVLIVFHGNLRFSVRS